MSTGGWGSDWPAQTTPKTYEQGIAEGERRERAAVVAALRRASNHGPMGLSLVNLDSIADAIERGEHRREEER